MPVNLTLLQTFLTVVQQGSLTRAARELHLTQPAVSKHLQVLEEHFGVKLMERGGHQVRLTEAGQVLHKRAMRALAEMHHAAEEIAQLSGQVQGQLTLAASTIPGQYVLPPLVAAFRRVYPLVQVRIDIGDSDEVVGRVLEEKADFGAVGVAIKHPKIVSYDLAPDRLTVIVPANHPLAKRPRIWLEDLQQEVLLCREKGSGTRQVLEERLAAAGRRLEDFQVGMELGSTEAIVNAVESGLGIGFVSEWAARRGVRAGTLAAPPLVGLDLERKLYLIALKKNVAGRLVQSFFQFVQEYDQ